MDTSEEIMDEIVFEEIVSEPLPLGVPATEFSSHLSSITFNPSTENGRGFLAPLLRSYGHFLYLLGRLSDTPTRRPTDNQIQTELDSITAHLTETIVPEYLSNQSQTQMTDFVSASRVLTDNFISWDMEGRINNLRMLANRAIQVSANLDRECVGIANSDAGQSL